MAWGWVDNLLTAGRKVSVGRRSVYSGSYDNLIQSQWVDDAFRVNASGSIKVSSGFNVYDDLGRLVPKRGGNVWWQDGYYLVPKLDDVTKTARSRSILRTSQSLPIPAGKTTLRLGIFAVIGYGTWRVLGVVGSVSDRAEDLINTFFGINCPEGDTECQESGAKNMLMSGLLVAALGVGVVILLIGGPSKKSTSTEGAAS